MTIQYTSALSQQEHRELLNRLKYEVFALIKTADEFEGITNQEIAKKLKVETATISGLTRPLVIEGKVRQLKKRPCKVTGNNVIAWTTRKSEVSQQQLL